MIDLLYEALRSEYGIVVQTNSVERLRAKLYEERRKDPAFSCLTLTPSPTAPGSEIWIVKKEEPDAEVE